MLHSPLSRLRLVGYLEGTSFLVLLGIAMPLKYVAGNPQPTLIVGWIHGLLFILYVVAVWQASMAMKWSRMRTAVALAAGFVPFGPFIHDARLRRDEQELQVQAVSPSHSSTPGTSSTESS
jgi:integral membrane protein